MVVNTYQQLTPYILRVNLLGNLNPNKTLLLEMEKFPLRIKVGKRLRELRIKSGYTSYETFAYDHGLPRQTVGRAETGKNLTMDSLEIMLKTLKVSPEEFFKGIK